MSDNSCRPADTVRKSSRISSSRNPMKAQAAAAALATARRETLGDKLSELTPRQSLCAAPSERARTAPRRFSPFDTGRTRLCEASARHHLQAQRGLERQPLGKRGPLVQARIINDNRTVDNCGLVQYSSRRASTVLTCTLDGCTEYSDGEESDNSGGYKCASRNHALFLRDHVYIQACSELHVHPNSRVRELLTRCSDSMCFCDLEVVSFRNCLLGDRGILAMLPLLTFARSLRCLSLVGNGMREGSLRQLVAALLEPTTCSNLLVLDLSQNDIPQKGVEWLLRFLPQRRQLLLLGLADAGVPEEGRKRLMMKSLVNFCAASPADMLEAWRLTMDDMRLADRDLWLRCNQLIQKQDSKVDKDALANADAYVEADSANVMSAEKPVFNERRRSSYISSDERVASVSSIKARKMFCPWSEQKKDEHSL
mmetsp:Transcript_18731/g.36765  ORF Transcript_18731/g.36765 Transcript_18731/m.36765 type:complete len:426 (-) Transcript_18731:371-1648(-)